MASMIRVALSSAFACLLALACGETAAPNPDDSPDAIIGGSAARGATLDAIGSLRTRTEEGAGENLGDAGLTMVPSGFDGMCTATLVSPSLIVTAKHCATRAPDTTVPRTDSEPVFFTIGSDSSTPKRVIRVLRTWLSPVIDEGYVGHGSDVAVMQLAEPVTDVKPLRVAAAHLPSSLVGSRLSAVGFGYRDRQTRMGARRAGTLTLQATSGRLLGDVFSSSDELIAFAKRESPEAFGAEDADRLLGLWDRTLLPEYEAFLGLAYGDAQPCNGDSGAPLVARVGDELVVAGVVSGSHKLSNRVANPCSVLGQVYATFGPLVQTTFDVAQVRTGETIGRLRLATVAKGSESSLPPETAVADGGTLADRCQGLPKNGRCSDGTVQRCIAEAEGPPRPARIDCTLLLSTCKMVSNVAGCVDVAAP